MSVRFVLFHTVHDLKRVHINPEHVVAVTWVDYPKGAGTRPIQGTEIQMVNGNHWVVLGPVEEVLGKLEGRVSQLQWPGP